MNTLIVSFFGGPGCGKSIFATDVFAKLKWKGIITELATEYAKDKFYEESHRILENQIYVFGKQHHRINRTIGKTQVTITDSPFLLGIAYIKKSNIHLEQLIIHEYKQLNTYNIFLNRDLTKFESAGRYQNLEQSIQIDEKVKSILIDNKIAFDEIQSCPENVDIVVNNIIKKI